MSELRNLACLTACVLVCSSAMAYEDEFEREDGPVDGWTVSDGVWEIIDGRMTTTADAAPGSWIFAGDPPIRGLGDTTISTTVNFPLLPGDAVGRHGGLIFFASQATQRNAAGMNGYTLDWIDRDQDHGFRLIRLDNGAEAAALHIGTPELLDPPEEWTVEIIGTTITLIADGEEIFSVEDGTYRNGHFGCWAYQNGTQIEFDSIEVESAPLAACITATPQSGGAPLDVLFDGSCSFTDGGEIVSYTWSFGDGSDDEEGESVEHTYDIPDNYVVTLTVEDADGNTAEATQAITVSPGLDGLWEDDFDRDDGPVDNWSVLQGEWNIVDGELNTLAAGTESWAYAGDPPVVTPDDNYAIEIEIRFNQPNDGGVGRHGGIAFSTDGVDTDRWGWSGYTLDWIDRADDHGFRFIRFDAGAHGEVFRGATDLPDPPEVWRLERIGDLWLIFGDGELLMQHTDGTYPGGHIGVWAYSNNNDMSIDKISISDEVSDIVFATRTISGVDCEGNATVDLTFTSSSGDVDVELIDQLPENATGVDAGDGAFENGQFTFSGNISEGDTITYTLSGLSPEEEILGETTTGGVTNATLGDQFGLDACPFGCASPTTGFTGGGILNAVVLGPIALDPATNADCFDGGNLVLNDYLINVDGDFGEEELSDPESAPVTGDSFFPDFGGLAGGLGVALAPNAAINPNAVDGELTAWLARADGSGYIDYNRPENLGNPLDNYVIYSFHYLNNTTGDTMFARIEVGTDDGVKMRLNGELIHELAVCRGVPGYGSGDMIDVELEEGMNVLMIAVVERGGGTGVRVVLRDEFGDPLTPFDEDEEVLVEVCKAAVEDDGGDDEICDNGTDDDGDGDIDCADADCADAPTCQGTPFVRGDVDSSGSINLSDGIALLLFQFQGGDAPKCRDAADTDDSGSYNLTDAIKIFQFLFLGGEAPLPPSPSAAQYLAADCGTDPSDDDAFDCATRAPACP